ncbi:GNAT family N-acetyltransferase [Dehalococcoidia bacterium]|nr:GNAT family N-acetyltransferase [Dehalococcoidia bacterium]
MQPTRFSIVLDIRPVDETTQEHARVLILSGLGERFGYIDEMLNQDLNDIVANYVEKAHIFLIGTIGNEIVCTGALVQEDQSTGRVVRMSVAKEYRRRGFGTAMLQRLMDLAREKDIENCWLRQTMIGMMRLISTSDLVSSSMTEIKSVSILQCLY